MSRTVYADPETGELREVKAQAAHAATALVEQVWQEVSHDYNLTPLAGLAVAQKIANAVLAAAVKEHADILSEPFKPQQQRLAGL